MTLKVNVYDEYWPALEELEVEVTVDENSVQTVAPTLLLHEVIDLRRLALRVPSILWPQCLRDRYDNGDF